MTNKRFILDSDFVKVTSQVVWDNQEEKGLTLMKLVDLLNEQQEFIEELQVSDEMGWKRAERFEKKCPKELHNKKMYIKRLEYKVQKFKEENEQLKEELNNLKKDETMLYHYYTLARYSGDGRK